MLEGAFCLTPDEVDHLTNAFGTPLYVLSEALLREKIRHYFAAFRAVWPRIELAYATKANSTIAVIQIAYQEGCLIDIASEGELRAALFAGVPASRCHFHGNNKSLEELRFAINAGVAQIVVDCFEEIDRLKQIGSLRETTLALRLAPGVDPVTHHKISTGQTDTKFGFSISDGSAERAVLECICSDLPLDGIHCHVGSQLLDPEAQCEGGLALAEFASRMFAAHGLKLASINVGGGLGVRYSERDKSTPVHDYCLIVADAVRSGLGGPNEAHLPVLIQEPGRSLVGECGVTLYRVGVIKPVGNKTYVAVDGGLADNPRPAMYGGEYTVVLANRTSDCNVNSYTVSGRHCETDLLFDNCPLPSDLAVGDILQVLCTGAYNSSMSSNYNRYRRPKTVLIRLNDSHSLVQREETWDEMFAREMLIEEP